MAGAAAMARMLLLLCCCACAESSGQSCHWPCPGQMGSCGHLQPVAGSQLRCPLLLWMLMRTPEPPASHPRVACAATQQIIPAEAAELAGCRTLSEPCRAWGARAPPPVYSARLCTSLARKRAAWLAAPIMSRPVSSTWQSFLQHMAQGMARRARAPQRNAAQPRSLPKAGPPASPPKPGPRCTPCTPRYTLARLSTPIPFLR